MSTFLSLVASAAAFVVVYLLVTAPPEAQAGKDPEPYVPQVISVPQEHAWCYVLVNENRAVGNINMFACVAKE